MVKNLLGLLGVALIIVGCGGGTPDTSDTAPADGLAASPQPKAAAAPETPRLIVYSNANTDPILDHADTLPYTHYILAFLIPDGEGGVKPSGALAPVLADSAALEKVRAAGKKVMVSVGGGTVRGEDWLALGKNAAAVAESIAAVVEEHSLDGVDLDVEAVPFETRAAFQPYADAVVALTRALAERLPGKFLTHAPQPPYLCAPGSPGCPQDSLYATILAAAGDQISWLNMQYYSNPPVTSSDIEELGSYRSIVRGWDGFGGLAADRLVVGKPYSSKVSGYQPADQVVSRILQPLVGEYSSSFGGFMAWELSEDPDGTWAAAVSQALHTISSEDFESGEVKASQDPTP